MVGRLEITKDTVQVITESAATHVGRIATIVSGAVREVTHEMGEWASDVFEMRDAAVRARADGADRAPYGSDDDGEDGEDAAADEGVNGESG